MRTGFAALTRIACIAQVSKQLLVRTLVCTPMPTTITVDTREGNLGVDISNSDECAGAKVDKVHPRDLLALAGLRAGMVITKVDGQVLDCGVQVVPYHRVAMDLMTAAKNAEKKLTLTVISAEEAKEQGKIEWQSKKKTLLYWLLALVVFYVLYFVAAKQGIFDGVLPGMFTEPTGTRSDRNPMPKVSYDPNGDGPKPFDMREAVKKYMEKHQELQQQKPQL